MGRFRRVLSEFVALMLLPPVILIGICENARRRREYRRMWNRYLEESRKR